MVSETRKKWIAKNRESIAQKNREWCLANPDRVREAQERWKAKNPGIAALRMREWRLANLERHKQCNRDNERRIKDAVFAAYGGYKCACCPETTKQFKEFLTIDHIDNDGAKHRKEIASGKNCGGKKTYAWLYKNNFPKGFQVLCMSCNFGKARNGGVCPHKTSEGSTTSRKA